MDDRHEFRQPDLAELVGSRLCHDLVNPLSAIANGIELLTLSGAARTPEVELIADAVGDAMARIRFFRVAFGAARAGETLSEREMRDSLSALYAGTRLALDLQVYFHDQLHAFVDSGKPVLGICNGFQTLVKAGVLPGNTLTQRRRDAEEDGERGGEGEGGSRKPYL